MKSSSETGGNGVSRGSCSLRVFRHFIVFLTIAGSLCSFVILSRMVSSDTQNADLDAAMTHLQSVRNEFRIGPTLDEKSKVKKSNESIPVANSESLPLGLRNVLERALRHQKICSGLNKTAALEEKPSNVTDLPDFGIIDALSNYQPSSEQEAQKWSQCRVPPASECNETTFSVVFLAHNPDRLQHMKRMIGQMIDGRTEWKDLVEEVIVVWNGERELNETGFGAGLEALSTESNLRIVYPLKLGYPNDLLNRYNLDVLEVKTKALLYYDDDGPFYSNAAIRGGFELWKRNSNAQIGAMARRLDVGPRQIKEKQAMFEGLSDLHFVSHCRANGDSVFYNYYIFAHFGANMVLPSGSFLHSDFLCFVWHPALEELRQFVRDDDVHPDDATVSMVVSQVAGRAPKVYPRRINPKKQGRRRLLEIPKPARGNSTTHSFRKSNVESSFKEKSETRRGRRKLLWEQAGWGGMRNNAVNSLVSYFGGLNSGSLGWCYGTEYHKVTRKKEDVCNPEMADVGMLPWMTDNHEPLAVCQ